MALSDLAVYSEYAYLAMSEVLDQQINLFNGASNGTITLAPAAHQGDYSEQAFFAKITGGTVRRRDAYGSGAVAAKNLSHLIDRSVKVAAGTPPIQLDPGQFRWIQQNPQVAGAALGQQLAVDSLADMLNTALGASVAAISQTAAVVNDISAAAAGSNKASFVALTNTAAKFGDRSSAIAAWIMHSTPMNDLSIAALTNAERLFVYGNVNILRDPFGRVFVITDAPSLQWSSTTGDPAVTTNGFYTLGLQSGAVYVGQNNDFDANEETRNGDENILRTYQAEWSYNLGVFGYAWDKANGGKSPTDAALFTSSNWDKYATSIKDTAGVILKSQ